MPPSSGPTASRPHRRHKLRSDCPRRPRFYGAGGSLCPGCASLLRPALRVAKPPAGVRGGGGAPTPSKWAGGRALKCCPAPAAHAPPTVRPSSSANARFPMTFPWTMTVTRTSPRLLCRTSCLSSSRISSSTAAPPHLSWPAPTRVDHAAPRRLLRHAQGHVVGDDLGPAGQVDDLAAPLVHQVRPPEK